MESATIFIIVAAAFGIWVSFFRQINPSNKTDEQLKKLYNIAVSNFTRNGCRFTKELELLTAEMEKRGLLGGLGDSARDPSGIPHITQVLAMRLRNAVRDSYDASWKAAEKEWPDDKRRHQHALTLVLLGHLQKELGVSSVSGEIIDMISFETIPFNLLDREAGKNAVVEYLVWKTYPDLANVAIVRDAISNARKNGLDDVLKNINDEKLGWLRWSELLI